MDFSLDQLKSSDSQYKEIVVNTINLQLTMGNPVSKILNMLGKMLDELLAKKQKEKADFFDDNRECYQDLDALKKLIRSAETDVVKYQRLIDLDEDILDDRKKDLARETKFLDQLDDRQKAFEATRSAENAKFTAARDEHQAVRQVIEACKKIIEDELTAKGDGKAFLELQRPTMFVSLGQILAKLKPLPKKSVVHNYNRVLLVLKKMVSRIQAPVQSDQDMVANIQRILDDLLENLDQSWAIEQTAEENKLAAFNDVMGYLKGLQDETKGDIKELNKQIQELEKTIFQNGESLRMQKDNHENGDKNLADQRAECKLIKDNHVKAQANFKEQIKVIRQAIRFLNSHSKKLRAAHGRTKNR